MKLYIISLFLIVGQMIFANGLVQGNANYPEPFVVSSPVSEKDLKAQHSYLYKIIKYIVEQQNRTLVIQHYSNARSVLTANKGIVDGELARMDDVADLYENLIMVPSPILNVSFVGYTRSQELGASIRKFEDLESYRLGIINGWTAYDAVKSKYKKIKVSDPGSLFRMLEKDRIDVALISKEYGDLLISKHKIGRLYTTHVFKRADVYFYVHKRHKSLVPALSKSVDDYKEKHVKYSARR